MKKFIKILTYIGATLPSILAIACGLALLWLTTLGDIR
jgi:hypothetical protein